MSDQFVAEIRIFPFNFPPTGWAFCDGQLLPLSQNTALFSLLGTTYGGDGKSTFALPDMQGSAPMNSGQGNGLSEAFLGEQSGSETVTLLISEMPLHNHFLQNAITVANVNAPAAGQTSLGRSNGGNAYQSNANANLQLMNFQSLPVAGGSLPHNNMQPYLTLNFCIALQGIFPARP
ncbi:MAG: tail fiber protein [Acidobacteria bacterium]|nr:tail fiber protein [Acidobacteriota bacterium]